MMGLGVLFLLIQCKIWNAYCEDTFKGCSIIVLLSLLGIDFFYCCEIFNNKTFITYRYVENKSTPFCMLVFGSMLGIGSYGLGYGFGEKDTSVGDQVDCYEPYYIYGGYLVGGSIGIILFGCMSQIKSGSIIC